MLLVDSEGPNLEDLLAAAQLALFDAALPTRIAVADDRRLAAVAESVAQGACEWGAHVAVGHFGARTALPASKVYGRHDVLFFAPGTSAPRLCDIDACTTWQFFARDDGQIDCLASAAGECGRVVLIGQEDNYGEDLARDFVALLARRKQATRVVLKIVASTAIRQLGELDPHTDLCIVLGSKEFVAAVLFGEALAGTGMPVLLADECFGADFLLDPRLGSRISVAYPAQTGAQLIDRPADGVRARAARWLGRRPGAYFDTSYVAVRAFAAAWRSARGESARQLGEWLRARPWRTTFGTLRFNDSRQLAGHLWTLQRTHFASRPVSSHRHESQQIFAGK